MSINMERKEFYRHNLPLFQQPGQAYFVTWKLKSAVPLKAYLRYTQKLRELKNQINFQKQQQAPDEVICSLQAEHQFVLKKYISFYNKLLDEDNEPSVNLTSSGNLKILNETLHFWEGKKLENHAYCIMSNHVHGVFRLFLKTTGESLFICRIFYNQ